MYDFQVRLYYEIELQVTDRTHPVQVLIKDCFNQAFMNHYKQYIVKSSGQTSSSDLLDKIINKTVGMQNEYVFKLADDAGRTDKQPDREEIDKRLQITLAN